MEKLKINRYWMNLINRLLVKEVYKLSPGTRKKLESVYQILQTDCKKITQEN